MKKNQLITEGLPFNIGFGKVVYCLERAQFQSNNVHLKLCYVYFNGDGVTIGEVTMNKRSMIITVQFGDITLNRIVKLPDLKLV